ncbi:MAG: flippase-like domain-containing protein [Candidatus Eisenbacteria bacterium]|nr:flippase-like domain-containing protein [Candidatus Eisenbacteria bacterium]
MPRVSGRDLPDRRSLPPGHDAPGGAAPAQGDRSSHRVLGAHAGAALALPTSIDPPRIGGHLQASGTTSGSGFHPRAAPHAVATRRGSVLAVKSADHPAPKARPTGRLPFSRRLILPIAISVLGIGVYAALTSDILDGISQLRLSPGHLLLALALMLLPWVLNALRVRNWLQFLGYGGSLRTALRVVILGELSAAVTPRAVGALPAKAATLMASGVSSGRSALMIVLAAVEDTTYTFLVVPVLLYATAVWEAPALQRLLRVTPAWEIFAAVALVGVLAIAATRYLAERWTAARRLDAKLRSVWRDLRAAIALVRREGRRTWLTNVGLTFLQWTARYSIAAAVILGMGIEIDFWQCLALQWLCFATMNLAPTPGSVGGAEASFLLLYSGILPPEQIAIAAFGWRFFTFYLLNGVACLLAPLLLARGGRQRRAPAIPIGELQALRVAAPVTAAHHAAAELRVARQGDASPQTPPWEGSPPTPAELQTVGATSAPGGRSPRASAEASSRGAGRQDSPAAEA